MRIKSLEKWGKASKGITLIALVITIIVLLILAAISIATLTGENGILGKANTAKKETEKASAKEKVQVAVMGSYGNDGNINNSVLKANLDNVEGIVKSTIPLEIKDETYPFEVTVDGYQVKIEKNGKVTVIRESDEETINPPEEKPLVPGEIVTGENKEYTNNGTAIVPEGFAIVPGCDDVSEGLVISDDAGDTELDSTNIVANGNQFVWVPVTNIANFKAIEGYYNGNLASILYSCSEPFENGYSTEQSEYDAMCVSVERNQGFYIGRYETGKDSEGNLIVKKNSPVYNNVGWSNSNDMTNELGGAVELSKNFTNGRSYREKVTSTLIYGAQWDATMQFFDSNYLSSTCDEKSYVRNGTNKGNYSSSLINTGSNENYKVKNIYDMAGNVYEWTMEAFGTYHRVNRGGLYANEGSTDTVSVRANNEPTNTYLGFGFRVALIV